MSSSDAPCLLAIDLGTKCGWTRGRRDERPLHGRLNLAGGRFDTAGMVFLRFQSALDELLAGVDLVAFEEVRRHIGVDAAHRYAGLLAVLLSECERRSLPATGIPVGTWKKNFVGKGNASKSEVFAEAVRRGFSPTTEDEADALGVWHYALVMK